MAFTLLMLLAVVYLFVGLGLIVDAVRRARRGKQKNRSAFAQSRTEKPTWIEESRN
jgi:hypothetical protein